MTGTWRRPDALIASGRGYAYVFPQDAEAPVWVPDHLVRPFNKTTRSPPTTETAEEATQKNEKDRPEDKGDVHQLTTGVAERADLETTTGAGQDG